MTRRESLQKRFRRLINKQGRYKEAIENCTSQTSRTNNYDLPMLNSQREFNQSANDFSNSLYIQKE